MLKLAPLAGRIIFGAAIINMYMPPHGRTDKIAHHRPAFVIRKESTTFYLKTSLIRIVNSPAGLRHRTMASFMLFLSMTLVWSVYYVL